MKHTLFAVAMLVAVLVAGCEDPNNIVNAPTGSTAAKTQLPKPAPRVMTFSASLMEPEARNAFTKVDGTLSYMLTVLTRDPIPPSPQSVAIIDMNINARLADLWSGTPVGDVSTSAHVEVPILDQGGDTAKSCTSFERTYRVRGRQDGLVLGVKYRVTMSGIAVSSVYLALVPIWSD